MVPLNTPLTFTDASKGNPTEYVWKLPGTDLKSSAEKDVTVKYVEEGQFDVDLAVSNDAGTSTTYIYGVKAGGESLAWNISAAENGDLGILQLGWYGNYGGTNWLGMEAFAEAFEKPAAAVTISGVNVYFASVTAVSTDAEITVSIAKPMRTVCRVRFWRPPNYLSRNLWTHQRPTMTPRSSFSASL